MHTVPAGSFPAAAVAAAMLNTELGAYTYDVSLAARTGSLSRVDPPLPRAADPPLTHASGPRQGCVYVLPMLSTRDAKAFFADQVQPILDEHVEHFTDAPRLVGSGFHYRVWGPPRQKELRSVHCDYNRVRHQQNSSDARRRLFVYNTRPIGECSTVGTINICRHGGLPLVDFVWQIYPATAHENPAFRTFGDAVAMWRDALTVDLCPGSVLVEDYVPHVPFEMLVPNMTVHDSALVLLPTRDPSVLIVYEWKRPDPALYPNFKGFMCYGGGWSDPSVEFPSLGDKLSAQVAKTVYDMLDSARSCALCGGALFWSCGAVVGHVGVTPVCTLCAGSSNMYRFRKKGGSVVCSWWCGLDPPGSKRVTLSKLSKVLEVCGSPGEGVAANWPGHPDRRLVNMVHSRPGVRDFFHIDVHSCGTFKLALAETGGGRGAY